MELFWVGFEKRAFASSMVKNLNLPAMKPKLIPSKISVKSDILLPVPKRTGINKISNAMDDFYNTPNANEQLMRSMDALGEVKFPKARLLAAATRTTPSLMRAIAIARGAKHD